MLYYNLFYIQRFCYLSWISGTWNNYNYTENSTNIKCHYPQKHFPPLQNLLRQHHFSPVLSLSIICLCQPQPKMAHVKKLILLPVYFTLASLIFLSPYRVHSSRHCFMLSFLKFPWIVDILQYNEDLLKTYPWLHNEWQVQMVHRAW